MPGQVIGIELPLGYPGSFARTPDCIIMNRLVHAESGAVAFGAPVVLNSDNTYSAFGAENTAAEFAGIAVREVKMATSYLNQNEVVYLAGQPCDVLERGNIVVACKKGTPTAGGKVYIRIAKNETYPGSQIGDFEAEADPKTGDSGSDKTIELSGVCWTTGRIDANGCAELTIKNRV